VILHGHGGTPMGLSMTARMNHPVVDGERALKPWARSNNCGARPGTSSLSASTPRTPRKALWLTGTNGPSTILQQPQCLMWREICRPSRMWRCYGSIFLFEPIQQLQQIPSKTAPSSILFSPDTMRKICNHAPPVALRDGWH